MKRWITTFLCALALSACVGRTAEMPAASDSMPARADMIADGRAMAEAQCASCHAVGEFGDSPVAEAPVFRTVLSRYRPEVLEEELIQGVRVAHPMPNFQFNPQGVDALIAYLQSIQTPPAR